MIVLWTDWRDVTYGFCSHVCAGAHRSSTVDPAAAPRPAEQRSAEECTARLGCWWCGADLTLLDGWLWLPTSGAAPQSPDRAA